MVKNVTDKSKAEIAQALYDNLVRALEGQITIDLDQYLVDDDFRSNAKTLYEELRTQGVVDCSYEEMEFQIPYYLRYLHIYWVQTYDALNYVYKNHPKYFEDKKELDFSLLCGGSGIEILGIMLFFDENPNLKNIKISATVFDRYSEQWQKSFNDILSHCLTKSVKDKLNKSILNWHPIDLKEGFQLPHSESAQTRQFHFCIFQNCINELGEPAIEVLPEVLKYIRQYGFIIYTDKYIEGGNMIERTLASIRDGCDELKCSVEGIEQRRYFRSNYLPEKLKPFFNDEGSFIATKNHNYSTLILRNIK